MSEQKKKRQKIYDLLDAETKSIFFFVPYTKQRKKILLKKNFLRRSRSGGVNKKRKEGFLTAFATMIKKDPTTSIKNHANELKVYEKTLRTAIKQNLSPDLNPLDYAIWGVLENKTNAVSHRNIALLMTAYKKE